VSIVPTLRTPALAAALAAIAIAAPTKASAEAMILIEADSGKVLHAENATMPWYPASITKVMTAYVTLQAVNSRRLTLDTLLPVSARAAAQQPSKMGFKPGTKVTVDNALKMLMVKSANDIAVVLAEGVSGSVEKFADEMNRASKRLGMTQSMWVNPNGLPAENQISSARDLAILARAVLREFPEYDFYWDIPAIKFGKKTMRNYNSLIGRYQGADGMKTGFICASGFNLVATATRNDKRLIAVVLGSPSSPVRAAKTAALLERGFSRGPLSWLAPSLGTVESLAPVDAAPPDLRDAMCGPHRKRPAAEEADEEPTTANGSDPSLPQTFMLSSLPPANGKASALLTAQPAVANPIVVHAGPSKASAEARVAGVRAKLVKAGKMPRNLPPGGKQPQLAARGETPSPPPKAAPAAAAKAGAASPSTTASVQPAAAQRPSQTAAAPAGAFAPPPDRFAPPGSRAMPAATDIGNPSWMSFAPATNAAGVAPLTAAPGATPEPQVAIVPMPRPRPKIATAAKQARKPR
jgi:D-alanyl-D-alanine carboxypeptidase